MELAPAPSVAAQQDHSGKHERCEQQEFDVMDPTLVPIALYCTPYRKFMTEGTAGKQTCRIS
jgi:hypothetical protein